MSTALYRAVDRQRADGGTGTAFEIYCGISGGWKAYHFRNGTVVRTKVRAEGMVFAAEHGVISGGYAIPRIQEIYSA